MNKYKIVSRESFSDFKKIFLSIVKRMPYSTKDLITLPYLPDNF